MVETDGKPGHPKVAKKDGLGSATLPFGLDAYVELVNVCGAAKVFAVDVETPPPELQPPTTFAHGICKLDGRGVIVLDAKLGSHIFVGTTWACAVSAEKAAMETAKMMANLEKEKRFIMARWRIRSRRFYSCS